TGKIMGMLGTIRGVLGDRQNARVKLPLESLDGGLELGLTNQRRTPSRSRRKASPMPDGATFR
ncbi:MAG: hypothetical protein WBE08_07880, partial [Methyloceanibacter sp.]